jgi:hypothetical protein
VVLKEDHRFAEKSFATRMREEDPSSTKRTVQAYAELLKTNPTVPNKGLQLERAMKDR